MDSVEFEKGLKDAADRLRKEITDYYVTHGSENLYAQVMAMENPLMVKVDQCIIMAKIIMRIEIEFITMKNQPDRFSIWGVPYDEKKGKYTMGIDPY